MSGKLIDSFFQDEKEYEGTEKRPKARYPHSPEHQAILNDVREISTSQLNEIKTFVKTGLPHRCTMPKEIQDNSIGIVNAGKEIGGNDFTKGIEVSRDTIKDVSKLLVTRSKIGFELLKWVAISVATVIATLTATGFFEQMKG